MHIIIPIWFYGFDSAMYMICSMIGFLLSFYFNKIYTLSFEKRHLYLYIGFLLLAIGFMGLGIASTYSYVSFKACMRVCNLGLIDDVFSVEDFAYFAYFGFSIAAYIMFLQAYRMMRLNLTNVFVFALLAYLLMIVLFMPESRLGSIWYGYSGYFHFTSLLILSYITFKNAVNYDEKKSVNSLLVVNAFAFLSMSHMLHLFSFVSGLVYVLAHIFMLIGFGSLLIMVVKIVRGCSVPDFSGG
ncbi:hypothetical protein A3K63_04410 [Candidatus Micrarchaeota archaeon RBG_16_49_10]|nr:MAG: hypothetical protein A3K63_04410 [Candidatus Micrarchaeota archaeon RBG_16_49_10]